MGQRSFISLPEENVDLQLPFTDGFLYFSSSGAPKPSRELERVDVGEAAAAKHDVRGGASQAPRLLHLPLQGLKDRQVSIAPHRVLILQIVFRCKREARPRPG